MLKLNKSYYKVFTLPYKGRRIFDMCQEDTKRLFDRAGKLTKIPLAERAICKVQRKIEYNLEKKTNHSYLEKSTSKSNEKSLCFGCGV